MDLSMVQKMLLWIARKTASTIIGKCVKGLVDKLYHSIGISEIYKEVYALAYDEAFPDEPEKSNNRNKVGIEYMDYMFTGNHTYQDLSPETLAVHNKFGEILAKRYPFAIQYFEAHKNDLRGGRIENKLDELAAALRLERTKISVTFDDDQTETTIQPSFVRKHYVAKQSSNIPQTQDTFATGIVNGSNFVQQVAKLYGTMNIVAAKKTPIMGKRNNSFCPIQFKIVNVGEHQIENLDIIFSFEDCSEIKHDNEEHFLSVMPTIESPCSHINETNREVLIRVGTLLPSRHCESDNVYVKIPLDKDSIKVEWNLSSAHDTAKGTLIIKSVPYIVKDEIVESKEFPLPTDNYVDFIENL